jgi:hypothetical protein
MQLSSIIFISSTLFFSAFANPIYDPNTKTAPPTQPTNPYTQPASPKYPYFTVSSYECRKVRPTCLFIGPDKEGKIRSSEDEFEMIHINRDDIKEGVVEVSFAYIPDRYTPDSNYRIRTNCDGQLVYGTEGDIVYFSKDYGLTNIVIAPIDVKAPDVWTELRWCGPGDTVEAGYLKNIYVAEHSSLMDSDCEIIAFSESPK